MFNPGLYFEPLDLTKTQVLLKLDLESYVVQAIETIYYINELKSDKVTPIVYTIEIITQTNKNGKTKSPNPFP